MTRFVLCPPRSAPSNATTTGTTESGVPRGHADLPGSYGLPGDLVEVGADQYRASVLMGDGVLTEYLVWAANTSNLGLIDDPAWVIDAGEGSIPLSGTLSVVGGYTDGTARVLVQDGGGRGISHVYTLTVVRGDDLLNPVVFTDADFAQAPQAGVLTLGAGALATLDGGLSPTRGDGVVGLTYTLSPATYWWTRNDGGLTRFGWDGRVQRWAPFRGSPPKDLGLLLETGTYTLDPRIEGFVVGDMLPGEAVSPDTRALVRVGARPDADAGLPVQVLVIADAEVAAYAFPVPGVDAVVGVTSGVIVFDPAYTLAHAGEGVWYAPLTFDAKSDGNLGTLLGASTEPRFITPVPAPTEYPFVSLGSRRPLQAIEADSDAALALLTPGEGEVAWSATTGKLKLSDADIAKSDPDDVGFDRAYLGARVLFTGVSLTQVPLSPKTPVALVGSLGTPEAVGASNVLYVPVEASLPAPGTSGIALVPDGTGVIPNASVVPATRPNGSGLVRSVSGLGDTFIFGRARAIETLEVVEFSSELPTFTFEVPEGTAYVTRALVGGVGSQVMLGDEDRTALAGDFAYFLQASVAPAAFAPKARVFSRRAGPFTVDGTEVLAFAVDGVLYSWNAGLLGAAGTYTAAQVAASLDAVITGTGTCSVWGGYLVLAAGNLDTGSVEIGFGSTVSGAYPDRDLSGCALLGFNPGWRVSNPGAGDNWLPDSGVTLGVTRSPQNLSRTGTEPDAKAEAQLADAVIQSNVVASPVLSVNNPPLEDVAGYDEDVFFRIVDGPYLKDLVRWNNLAYAFADRMMYWTDVGTATATVPSPSNYLTLGNGGVIGSTLHPALGTGYGLYLAPTGGVPALQEYGTDFTLQQGGATGLAVLTTPVGGEVTSGSRGSFTSGDATFTDATATFVTDGVTPGFRIEVTSGDARAVGSYVVTSVTSETVVEVAPSFPVSGAGVSWRAYEGFPSSTYDPSILADAVYGLFNPLPVEPFEVWLLSDVGMTPPDKAAQALSPLVANATRAIQTGRAMRVRFQLASGSPEAVLTSLSVTRLGTLANNALSVPDISTTHFTEGAFAIRVGDATYTDGAGTLTGVAVFTTDLPGDVIEYGDSGAIEGELNFGSDVLTERAGALVYYAESFRDPDDMLAGEAEINPLTGVLHFSTPDMAAYGSNTVAAYFAERMITEARTDVVVSPMQGTVYFNTPLRAGQIVEVTYYQANSAGEKASTTPITEFLPLYVRQEDATYVSDRAWTINPTSRTIPSGTIVNVWVDNRLRNYGNTDTVSLNGSTLEFVATAPAVAGSVVRVNYAVLEAFGGECAFTVSTPPVYRPPFRIAKGSSTVSLVGDRTGDLIPGQLLRVGTVPLYVQDSSYDASTDATTLTVYPPPPVQVGSSRPGNDVPVLLTASPVIDVVNSIPTAGSAGFMLTLTAAYDAVDVGSLTMAFQGDVTRYTQPGHLADLAGYPHLVASTTLSPDGRVTLVSWTTPLEQAMVSGTDVVRISVRPIYPAGGRALRGVAPVSNGRAVQVIRFEEDGTPGRSLVRDVEFGVDEPTGAVTLLAPQEPALAVGDVFRVSYASSRVVGPALVDGAVVLPTYQAKYDYVTVPSGANGYLGVTVYGAYTFASPDSFYVRAVPMASYLGEVQEIAISRFARNTPHGGPAVTSGPDADNWDYGTLTLRAEIQSLRDQDRAGREFTSLYDGLIQAFEQVLETIDGRVIGDRDGKFRFFVGRDRTYAPPGYEDEITGNLNPRSAWSDVFLAANGSFTVTEADPLVLPSSATQDPVTRVVSGATMDPWTMGFYVAAQKQLVLNDVDDRVLVGRSRAAPDYPYVLGVMGEYQEVWEPSSLSRLYPETTLAFTTTYPGIGSGTLPTDPGVYAFLKLTLPLPFGPVSTTPLLASTFGMEIARISNPALGTITGITNPVRVQERLPRARVWAYSETGFPNVGTGSSAGKPSVIATVLPLADFPVDADTGLPDVTQLAAGGGALQDLSTGYVSLSTPPFLPTDPATGAYAQLALGDPSGQTYQVASNLSQITTAVGITIPPVFVGVYVDEVLEGCILTFTDGVAPITDAAALVRVGLNGATTPFAPELGDTIYVIPPTTVDTSAAASPPTTADMAMFAASQPFLDVGVRASSFVDVSLPSVNDPSPLPLKELLFQKPAKPLQCIEARVDFTNASMSPHAFPALLGEDTNDSGDYTIPYLALPTTELDALGQVASGTNWIMLPDNLAGTGAVYPDEVLGDDGSVLGVAVGTDPPATLLTGQDFLPVGVYAAHSGVGNVAPYDLLLVEVGQAGLSAGATGILSVGAVTSNTVEPPRFVTPCLQGTRTRYVFENAMAHLTSTGLTGMDVTEIGPNTVFDTTTVTGLFWNDGSGFVVGGLNNLVGGAFPGNLLTFRLIDQGTGLVVETITYDGNTGIYTGGAGAVAGAAPAFTDSTMVAFAIGFVSTLGTLSDFTVTIDTYNGGAATAGSVTAYVGTDRLTFAEDVDFRTALPRGTVTTGALSVEGGLRVRFITASGNVTCDVNDAPTVNGGSLFTFIARDAAFPTTIGTFDPSPGSGEGTVKVMAYEEHGNVPIVSTTVVTFSGVPSSAEDEAGDILAGHASSFDGQIFFQGVISTAGDIANVESGDVVTVTSSWPVAGDATVKAGTYLVRHAVPEVNPVLAIVDTYEVTARAMAGSSDGWVQTPFPKVATATLAPFEIAVTGHLVMAFSPSGHNFTTNGTLYLLVDPNTPASCVVVDYVGANLVGDTLVFPLTNLSGRDGALGVGIPNADVVAAAAVGILVSGMVYLPVATLVAGITDNTVGYDNGVTTAGGFTDVMFTSNRAGSVPTVRSYPVTLQDTTGLVPGAPVLGVWVSDVPGGTYTSDSTTFLSEKSTPVYEGVPMFLDVSVALNLATWNALHGGWVSVMPCLFPLDVLVTDDGAGNPGYLATSGVYLEPSFARPTTDLGSADPHVVDAGHGPLPLTMIGMRDHAAFGVPNPQSVSFTVRRIRRFHAVLDDFDTDAGLLRYVYETRRGTVGAYVPGTLTLTAGGAGTQLGGFTDTRVNVHAGDTVRVFSNGGFLLDSAEVGAVLSDTSLLLRAPGFTEYVPVGGEAFEVYLRQAPVPHEQSNAQLYAGITGTVLYEAVANPTTGEGGTVAVVDELTDPLAPDYEALGIQAGDILVVDPAGVLTGPTGSPTPPEQGMRPMGDTSVVVRGDGSYVAGSPSQLDDNRGWYRITVVTGTTLTVTGVTPFTGLAGSPVIFGASAPTDQRFVVLPDVTASGLGGSEGQMGLRITAPADVSNSYLGNYFSIEPFSYTVFRPSNVVGEETVDLILLLRERMLSWIEALGVVTEGGTKSGSYYVFQRDEHVSDLGETVDPTSGLGVPSNALITDISGEVLFAPFASSNDCLSVLDRRVWCGDTRLDSIEPPYSVAGDPYTSLAADNSASVYTVGSGRPVEPDRVTGVLDRTDRLRASRFAWIKFRTNRLNGTLPMIARAEDTLPEREEEARNLALLRESFTRGTS